MSDGMWAGTVGPGIVPTTTIAPTTTVGEAVGGMATGLPTTLTAGRETTSAQEPYGATVAPVPPNAVVAAGRLTADVPVRARRVPATAVWATMAVTLPPALARATTLTLARATPRRTTRRQVRPRARTPMSVVPTWAHRATATPVTVLPALLHAAPAQAAAAVTRPHAPAVLSARAPAVSAAEVRAAAGAVRAA